MSARDRECAIFTDGCGAVQFKPEAQRANAGELRQWPATTRATPKQGALHIARWVKRACSVKPIEMSSVAINGLGLRNSSSLFCT